MAELYGKVEGCSGGYGGSMHLYDLEVGNLGANAVVGGGLPAIVGAALAFQMRGEKRVAVAFFGDGATNTGTFHESMNLAQLWKVPAIFVLENNGWAESTPASQQLPLARRRARQARARVRDEAHRGRRPGRRGRLPRRARGARARARRARARCSSTCARTGSPATTSAIRRSTATRRRCKQERETKDPIRLLGARLELADEEFAAIDAEVTAEVEAAVEFAKAGTDPAPEDALKYVYA